MSERIICLNYRNLHEQIEFLFLLAVLFDVLPVHLLSFCLTEEVLNLKVNNYAADALATELPVQDKHPSWIMIINPKMLITV